MINRAQSLKQSVEKALGAENVVVDIQQMSEDDLFNITYYAPNAAAEDWDISILVSWGPDYQDPSTYLEIIKPGGENTKTFLGFDGKENAAADQVGLKEYAKLVDEAAAEKTDVNKRYEKYAAAQAWLTDSALLIPITSRTGRPVLTKIVPFTAPFAWSGAKGRDMASYKYLKLQDKAVTAKNIRKLKKNGIKNVQNLIKKHKKS